MRRHAAVAAAAVSSSTEVGAMQSVGGPVQHTSTSYAIYWTPPGSVTSANFGSVIQGYLANVGGSSYYGIATQYGDRSGLIQNSSSFGGAWVDPSPFPLGQGSSAAPLTDADIQSTVATAIRNNPQWGTPDLTKSFFVFLPFGIYLSEGGTESFTSGGFCAYHSYFVSPTGANVVYAAMPYAGTDVAGCGRPGPYPNGSGDPLRPGDADNEVNLVSHEQLEAVTDPLLSAWGFPSTSPIAGYEIGDVCLGINGPRRLDGSNVTLHGQPFLVQAQWSNAAAPPPNDTQSQGCVITSSSASTTSAPPSTTTSTSPPTTTPSTTTPSTTTPPSGSPSGGGGTAAGSVTRLAGADRVATAIAISNSSYPQAGSAGAAVVSRSDGFADALAGTPLAAAKHAPLLLTPPGSALDSRVAAEIARAVPTGGTVFILGGPGAVSPAVDAALAPAYNVVRLAGSDRFSTAVMIADQGLGNPGVQLLATGLDFPDALAGGAAAAHAGGVVLLTSGSTMPSATAAYLAAHPATRWALGGPASAAAGPAATAVTGADRYATAAAIAHTFFPNPSVVGVASGATFPDALGGGVHAAQHHGPLVLVAPDGVPAALQSYLAGIAAGAPSGFVYGGSAAVPDAVLGTLTTLL